MDSRGEFLKSPSGYNDAGREGKPLRIDGDTGPMAISRPGVASVALFDFFSSATFAGVKYDLRKPMV